MAITLDSLARRGTFATMACLQDSQYFAQVEVGVNPLVEIVGAAAAGAFLIVEILSKNAF